MIIMWNHSLRTCHIYFVSVSCIARLRRLPTLMDGERLLPIPKFGPHGAGVGGGDGGL